VLLPAGAVLFRCAQPLVGVMGRVCGADERIVRAAVDAMGDGRGVVAIDCRRRAAPPRRARRALVAAGCRPPCAECYLFRSSEWASAAQRTLGGGSERAREAQYGIARMHFAGIDNAAAQQASAARLRDSCRALSNFTLRNLSRIAAVTSGKWCDQVHRILSAACDAAEAIDRRRGSVLVHCSDGWNRTPQVVALAQLLLDPYYRTFQGFQVLIEKEWVAFGHCFPLRLGHTRQGRKQQAPIFIQFLDAVWQLLQTRRHAFEFREGLLLALADAALSRRWGTFAFDSPRDAARARAAEVTRSVWPELDARRDALAHARYRPVPGLLVVRVPPKDVQIWAPLYLRYADAPEAGSPRE